MENFSEYLTAQEAADFLGVTKKTLQNWEKKKVVQFQCYRHPINNYRLYKREELEDLLRLIKKY